MLATIVTVMLDAFSGLTNPVWPLSTQDAGQLQASVNRIVEQHVVESPRIPDLGYRGLVIQGLDVSGKPAEVRIYRRWVIIGSDADARAFQVEDNKLEMWLVEIGRTHVPPNRIPADLFPQK